MRMKLINKGHIVGWEDIVRGRKYTTSARCFSKTGVMLKISGQEFINEIRKDRDKIESVIDESG